MFFACGTKKKKVPEMFWPAARAPATFFAVQSTYCFLRRVVRYVYASFRGKRGAGATTPKRSPAREGYLRAATKTVDTYHSTRQSHTLHNGNFNRSCYGRVQRPQKTPALFIRGVFHCVCTRGKTKGYFERHRYFTSFKYASRSVFRFVRKAGFFWS